MRLKEKKERSLIIVTAALNITRLRVPICQVSNEIKSNEVTSS